jgi:hypothetical protein
METKLCLPNGDQAEPLGKQALYHQYWKDCGKDTFRKVAVLELATFSVAVSVEKWRI